MRYILSFAILLFVFACAQNEQKPHNAREIAEEKKIEAAKPENKLKPINKFIDSYLQFTEALVIAKEPEALVAYNNFKKEVSNFGVNNANISADKLAAIQPLLAALNKVLSDTNAQNVKSMRIKLKAINYPLLEITKLSNSFGTTLYNQFCPMAFDNKGGNWLSTNPEVRNPYFGDEMLNCGYTQDSLMAK